MKKLELSRETLRRLSSDSLGQVQGGNYVDTYTCNNCPTDACPTADCGTLPTIDRSITR